MSEIFRHLRFKWFNCATVELENLTIGGVSFLLTPVDQGIYDVWIDITPSNISFSQKGSVNRLRSAKERGIKPFTSIKLNGEDNLLDQICKHFVNTLDDPHLPSTVSTIVANIYVYNAIAEANMLTFKQNIENSVQHYNVH